MSEETIDKPKRMSDKELMSVQAKTGISIDLSAFSKEPKDPNRPPRLPAKLGSRLHDEVDPHPNTRVEFPVQWDWQHRIAQPTQGIITSTLLVMPKNILVTLFLTLCN